MVTPLSLYTMPFLIAWSLKDLILADCNADPFTFLQAQIADHLIFRYELLDSFGLA